MTKNMGKTDRIIRTIAAIVFLVLYFTGTVTGIWGIVLLILAIVFLLTSLIGFCPLYKPFGIKTTCEKK
ncbi:MAG: YgaP family membrane protein [Paludibacteraceae bacterium]